MTETPTFLTTWLSPPGETILDILDERGWSQVELAHRLDYTRKHINELIKGKAPLSAETAERLSRVLGSTSEFWLVREAQYRAALERRKTLDTLKAEASWLKELPKPWLRRLGLFEKHSHPGAQVEACLSFFGVATVEAWRLVYESHGAAFRSSEAFTCSPGAIAAWLRQGERQAQALDCSPYDKSSFQNVLQDIRLLSNIADPSIFVPQLVRLCSSCGVAVTFIPAPEKCPVSGAARWLSKEKALIMLSLRHKTNDHLWFTFFHEAAHILLHSKKKVFVDGADGVEATKEEEANRFAGDWLIPEEAARSLAALSQSGYVSKEDVRSFAHRIDVHPGIVVGRMQKEGWIKWSHMNDLKIHYTWDVALTHERAA